MSFHPRSVGLAAVVGVLLTAQTVAAQVDPTVSSPVRGWVLGGSTSIASAADHRGVAFGAAVAWDFNPRWGIEVGGQWFDRPSDEQAWTAVATAQFRVLPGARAVPYVRAGLAAHTMTLTSARDVPEFYRARMNVPPAPFVTRRTFTDPAIAVGGGFDLQVTRNIHVRPAVDALAVLRDGKRLVVPMGTVQVSYHFETQRITPARRR